ncbi:MAG: hypothetical protein J6I50_09370 [Clostridia bacterium]|nr:hypothetical protein [Clostridia bacterium]
MQYSNLYFCQIPYYEFYDGTENADVPECMNFLPVDIVGEDHETHELLFGALTSKKTLPQKICARCTENDGVISDATVVFCAKAENGALVTVGWYSHANVTAVPELLPLSDEDGSEIMHPFFFCTYKKNAVLLPPEERFQPKWQIPRGKSTVKGNNRQTVKFGFSSDTLWLCDEPLSAAQAWKQTFYETILDYSQNGDNMLDDTETKENE